jgi:hypothetical protein
MKNFRLSLILLIVLSVLSYSSCAKDDNDNDGIEPQISDIRFNFNDTIMWEDTAITINDTLTKETMDTLVIGKIAYMSGRFTTNKDNALSGYKVIFNFKMKDRKDNIVDTFLVAVGANIFGQTDISISRNNLLILPDSILRREESENIYYYPMEGEANLDIACIDIYGNLNSITHPVKLLSRETIYNSRSE